jgi:octaprenyl-diphosphate synthase
MDIKTLSAPIKEDLKIFNQYFRETMRSEISYIDVIARYLVKQKGKRIRPFLVLLTAKMSGNIDESTYRGAALVEILHTATLIHDDVIDDADTRRGLASINAIWKNKIAVLMGDYLLAKGLLLSLDNRDHEYLKIISDSVRRMSEAEILQIAKSRQLDLDEKTYLKIIFGKTASLIATCTEIGAVSAKVSGEEQKKLRDFGENLGMAFQIRDDLLDYIGKRSITGKQIGKDMMEKKLTLPMIHALEKAPRRESAAILRIIKKGAKKKELENVIKFVDKYGGIKYSEQKAKYYADLAKKNISEFPDSPSKTSLNDFIAFVVDRDK